MTEVLSQAEIDQLLAAINAGDSKPDDFRSECGTRKIKIYDFKRPDKFTKEHIRSVSIIHDNFARLITRSLSTQLQSTVHVHIASVDQLTYEEFIRSIPTPTTLAIIKMAPLDGKGVLEIDPAVTFSILDRVCGGTGEGIKSQHELTGLETSIMEDIISHILGGLRDAWTEVMDLRPTLEHIETNPQFAQIAPLNEMIILVTLETKVGEVEGMMNFCIPYPIIKPISGELSNFGYGRKQKNAPLPTWTNLKSREDIPVRLSAEILCRNYSIKEITKWKAETLIVPLRPLTPGYCYLRLGDRRVWRCKILPDCKWFTKRIAIGNYAENPFGTEGKDMKIEKENSLVGGALYNAGINISVELGTAMRTLKEVFGMGEGTIVELDKLAEEPVDIKANGTLIAYGEVVVIDEHFGVRITEMLDTPYASEQPEQQQATQESSEPTA